MFLMPAQLAITSAYSHGALRTLWTETGPARGHLAAVGAVTEPGLQCGLFHPALPGCVEDPETALPAVSPKGWPPCPDAPH